MIGDNLVRSRTELLTSQLMAATQEAGGVLRQVVCSWRAASCGGCCQVGALADRQTSGCE